MVADNFGFMPQYAYKLPTIFRRFPVPAIMNRFLFLQLDVEDCFHWPVDLTGGNSFSVMKTVPVNCLVDVCVSCCHEAVDDRLMRLFDTSWIITFSCFSLKLKLSSNPLTSFFS